MLLRRPPAVQLTITRLRKVKCDETRPVCRRCVKASRVCEGYGVWGQDRVKQSNVSAGSLLATSIARKPLPTTTRTNIPGGSSSRIFGSHKAVLSDQQIGQLIDHGQRIDESLSVIRPSSGLSACSRETSLLDWYVNVASRKLSGTFCSKFWAILVPQTCQQEPVVFYSVLALASAHRARSMQRDASQQLADTRWTLETYTRAIGNLRKHLKRGDAHSSLISYIACIVLACLEIVQDRCDTAMLHLSGGREFINQFASTSHNIQNDATWLVVGVLRQFSLQASQMNLQRGSWLQEPANLSSEFTTTWKTVEQAREHLDSIQIRIQQMHARMVANDATAFHEAGLDEQREGLRADLRSWLRMYAASQFETDPLLPQQSRGATIVLRMCYQKAVISTELCRLPYLEGRCDDHTARFMCIIDDAVKMFHAVRAVHEYPGPQFPGDPTGAVMDIGWIPATYFVASKCRVREIRLRAIKLLESTQHTEGMWNARICANVARQVWWLEEGFELSCEPDECQLSQALHLSGLTQPVVPESKRVSNITLLYSSENVKTSYLRRLSAFHGDIVVHENIMRVHE